MHKELVMDVWTGKVTTTRLHPRQMTVHPQMTMIRRVIPKTITQRKISLPKNEQEYGLYVIYRILVWTQGVKPRLHHMFVDWNG
jgi:hypothetical protein